MINKYIVCFQNILVLNSFQTFDSMFLDLTVFNISIFSCVLPFFITLENKPTNPLPPVKKRGKLVISPVGAPIAPTNDETATLSIGTGTKELNLYKKNSRAVTYLLFH